MFNLELLMSVTNRQLFGENVSSLGPNTTMLASIQRYSRLPCLSLDGTIGIPRIPLDFSPARLRCMIAHSTLTYSRPPGPSPSGLCLVVLRTESTSASRSHPALRLSHWQDDRMRLSFDGAAGCHQGPLRSEAHIFPGLNGDVAECAFDDHSLVRNELEEDDIVYHKATLWW